jgi:hypothetical protein
MPAKNPRTNLTLPADLDAVITDLAHLQGTAKAKIITELLLEVQPVLEQMRDALRAAQENKDDALKVAMFICCQFAPIRDALYLW